MLPNPPANAPRGAEGQEDDEDEEPEAGEALGALELLPLGFVVGAVHFLGGDVFQFFAAFAGVEGDAAVAGGEVVGDEIGVVFALLGVVGGGCAGG